MRRSIVVFFILCTALGMSTPPAVAQQPLDVSLTSERQPVRVAWQPLWQHYSDDGQAISEWSVPLLAVVPLRDDLLLGLRTGVASASGTDLSRVTGLGDVQATLSYTRPVGAGSIIANLGVNLPSGTTALAADEFETMTLLSQNFYGFRMPGLGQGFNLAPGLTWAVPVAEQVMVGLGASYQLRGSYSPIEALDGRYDPGDEVRLTGGFDVQTGPTSTLSGDVTVTLYGTDTIDDVEQYGPGRKLTLTAQYLHAMGFNVLRAVARYQSQARSSVPVGVGGGTDEQLRVLPNQGAAFVTYRYRVRDRVHITWRADGRFFGETAVYSSKSLFSVGAAPEFSFEGGWALTPRFAYTLGSFTGVEAGLGVTVEW